MDRKKLYSELDKKVVELAKYSGVSNAQLKQYFVPQPDENYLFKLASSLQNSGRMSNSIKFNDHKEENKKYRDAISKALCGFQMQAAWARYRSGTPEDIRNAISAEEIDTEAKPKENKEDIEGKKGEHKSNWKKYCTGLYDGLKYLSDVGENEINSLVAYNKPELSDEIIKRVQVIQSRIYGLGFSLTCDWLKECGCTWLAKPDVHIKTVVASILGKDSVSDVDTIKFIFNWAREIGDSDVTAYKIDRMIWLLCTGNFYLHEKVIGRKTVIDCVNSLR